MIVEIGKIKIKNRIRKDFGDIQELADDIKQNGLINPPVVNRDYELLAGERRLRACKSLGWQQIEVRMMDTRDAEHELNVEISENDVRKGFTKSERVDYMYRLMRIEKEKARERMSDGGGSGESGRQKSDNPARADETTAEQFGISRDTMRKEMQIVEHKALLDPADFADWDEGRLSTNKAYQKMKESMQDLREERDYLQSQVKELQNAEPQVIERTIEVVPDDYKEIKEKVSLYKIQAKSAEESRKRAFAEYREKLKEANDRIKDLEERKGLDELQKKLEEETEFFAIRTYDYIQKNGGYVWITERMDKLPKDKRKTFISTIYAIDAFAKQMVNNIGGYEIE